MKLKNHTISIILLLLSFSISSRSMERTISFFIVDSTSKPIQNAYVELSFSISSDTVLNGLTNYLGILTLEMQVGKYDLAIRHAKYNQLSTGISISDSSRSFEFQLNRCFDYYSIEGQIEFKPKLNYNPFNKNQFDFPTIKYCAENLDYDIDSTGHYHVNVPVGINEIEFWHVCNKTIVKLLMPAQKVKHIVNVTFDNSNKSTNPIDTALPDFLNIDSMFNTK